MTSNYKRLGDYIRQVDVRNKDLKVERLLGVNLSKVFIPSVANTIGTDMSKYKIIKKNQFGCKLMSVGRDGIMPISLYKQDSPSLISSAYYVFEVNNQDELLPDFLFMWLIRPEFDRQLAFYAGADVRGGVTWDFLCDMPIIVPAIDRQRELVAQYESLSRRIRINEQMIATLEDTAQALYRKMFVEGIDKENLPEGWRMGTLGEVASIKAGGDKPHNFSDVRTEKYIVPVIANGVENKGIVGYTDKESINSRTVTISARGTIGKCFVRNYPYFPIVRLLSVLPHNDRFIYYLWFTLSAMDIEGDGSVQSQLTIPYLEREELIIPAIHILSSFEKIANIIFNNIEIKEQENKLLYNIQLALLSNFFK